MSQNIRLHDASILSVSCFSPVGRQYASPGAQELSIGIGCNHKGIIMHELLHALGFWHEQSRSDRDDFLEVLWENIQKGMYLWSVWSFTPRSDLLVFLLYNTRAMLGRKITRKVTLWTRSYLYSLEWHQMHRFKICMKCVSDNTKIAIDRIILIVEVIIIILITIPNSYTRQL